MRLERCLALLAVQLYTLLPNIILAVAGNDAAIGYEYYGRDELSTTKIKSNIISQTRFSPEPNSKIIFYVHGFLAKDLDDGEEGGSGSRKMKDEIFEKRPEVDYVVLVDWTRYSDVHFSKYRDVTTTKVPRVAASVGNEIERLIDTYSVDPSEITLMAHSLGSHISGQVGRNLKAKGKELGLIIGKYYIQIVVYHKARCPKLS